MSWSSVTQAKEANRHELLLSGKDFSELLKSTQGKLDENMFSITQLNFLRLSSSTLSILPPTIKKLVNITNLELQNNNLESLPNSFQSLKKLKLLDISNNKLTIIPDSFNELISLATLNACGNNLQEVPSFQKCQHLAHLDLRMNQITSILPFCHEGVSSLSDILLASNQLDAIPEEIGQLISLKSIDLTDNKIKFIPADILSCSKLKEISLKGNPLSDRRLSKLVESNRSMSRQVLDYIQKNSKSGAKKGDKKKGKVAEAKEIDLLCDRLSILTANENQVITITPDVKDIRGFIVCCIVKGLDLSGPKLKKFIAAQTRLHDGICDKRVTATIATHDVTKVTFPLAYTAKSPGGILIQPLNKVKNMKAVDLVRGLRNEAENLRKQMKRNTYSGIHKYIHLLQNWDKWPVLQDNDDTVISFPPITNSEITKISSETKDVFVEVTSSASLTKAKEVMEAVIKTIIECDLSCEKTESGRNIVEIEQVRVSEEDGALRVVFPSRMDLVDPAMWEANLEIIRR